ncbi:hypothetical protein WDU94_008814, partial [Cyamophila willieti]
IFFHGSNPEGLLKYFDAKCIPIKYGGDSTTSLESGHELWKLWGVSIRTSLRKAKYGYTSTDSKESKKLKDILPSINNEEITVPDKTGLI